MPFLLTVMTYSSAACLVVTFCLTTSNTIKIPPPDKTKGTRFTLKIECLTVHISVFLLPVMFFLFSRFLPIILNLFGDFPQSIGSGFFYLCLFRGQYLADPVTDYFSGFNSSCTAASCRYILREKFAAVHTTACRASRSTFKPTPCFFKKQVRLVVCVQLVPVAFCINGLHRFPADFLTYLSWIAYAADNRQRRAGCR